MILFNISRKSRALFHYQSSITSLPLKHISPYLDTFPPGCVAPEDVPHGLLASNTGSLHKTNL